MISKQNDLFPNISKAIQTLDVAHVSEERKAMLQPLIDFIQDKTSLEQQIRLIFICTHNSRRSHFAQVWAQSLAFYFDVPRVHCYSGGTETTALFPEVVSSLEDSGFQIQRLSEGSNPVHGIRYAANEPPVIGFSKTYPHAFNPQSKFAAIMTCSEADGNCPFVPGAEKRISIPYEDPKLFDNTPKQAEKYLERSMQIATELCYVFSQIQINR